MRAGLDIAGLDLHFQVAFGEDLCIGRLRSFAAVAESTAGCSSPESRDWLVQMKTLDTGKAVEAGSHISGCYAVVVV